MSAQHTVRWLQLGVTNLLSREFAWRKFTSVEDRTKLLHRKSGIWMISTQGFVIKPGDKAHFGGCFTCQSYPTAYNKLRWVTFVSTQE
jgi:hypothetical protein